MTVSMAATVAERSASDWSFRAESVTKIYGRRCGPTTASRCSVRPGEVYGLLGPNGAGKSTLVKQVIGLLKPTAGQIRLGPFDLVADPDAARQLCSYLPQAQMPIDSFRAREAIELTGRIRGGDRAAVRRRAAELIEALDLGEWANTWASACPAGSSGWSASAMVTVWPGRVVILDEPTNDVDPLRRRLLWDQIRLLGERGCAVLLVTHNVMEAEKSVDRLAIISAGRLIAEGTPSSLKADDRGHLRLQVMLGPRPRPRRCRPGCASTCGSATTSSPRSTRPTRPRGIGWAARAHRPRRGGGVRARRDHPRGRLHPPHRPRLGG